MKLAICHQVCSPFSLHPILRLYLTYSKFSQIQVLKFRSTHCHKDTPQPHPLPLHYIIAIPCSLWDSGSSGKPQVWPSKCSQAPVTYTLPSLNPQYYWRWQLNFIHHRFPDKSASRKQVTQQSQHLLSDSYDQNRRNSELRCQAVFIAKGKNVSDLTEEGHQGCAKTLLQLIYKVRFVPDEVYR